jgi:serine/threonine protein phosphatase PrpC
MALTLRFEASARTDVGHMRQHNEDGFGCFPELGLYLVADGMGGHSSGDRASKLVVDTAREFFEETAAQTEGTATFDLDPNRSYQENRLVAAVALANQRVWELTERDPTCKGLGSTVAAVSLFDGRAQIAHVGDSRVYRLHAGALEPLTEDHSLLLEYRKLKPDLTPEEIASIPRNIITRAIGMSDRVAVDSRSLAVDGGDVLLLSTDGVHGLVPDDHLRAILLEHQAPAMAVEKLIAAALRNGGSDNATCVVIRVTG